MKDWTDKEVLVMYNSGKLADVKSDLLCHKIKVIRGEATVLIMSTSDMLLQTGDQRTAFSTSY